MESLGEALKGMVKMEYKYTKFRYMAGKETYPGKKFDGLQQTLTSTEGHSIVGNQRWIAVSKNHIFVLILLFDYFQHTWKAGGGGAIACYGAQEFGKKNVALPVIAGHQGPVMDLNFSPMHD